MLRPNSYIDKERFVKLLKEKIDEGYDIIKNTTLESKEIGRIVVDFIQLDKTLEQIEQEDNFDKQMMSEEEKKEINDALSKNKVMEVNR